MSAIDGPGAPWAPAGPGRLPAEAEAEASPGALAAAGALGIGARGPEVGDLQEALARAGFPAPNDAEYGVFGRETAGSLAAFQRSRGLPPTGTLDPGTREALARAPAAAAPPQPARPFRPEKDRYFDRLDRDPIFRAEARSGAIDALTGLLTRADVPAALDRAYAREAGSAGGGRVLFALDYTRGFAGNEGFLAALRKGPKHFLVDKVFGPLLAHFRTVDGASLFPGDAGMAPAFRDSQLWGPRTNQVGHLLCAVDLGARIARLEKHPLERRALELAMRAADRIAGLDAVEPTLRDWARMALIGHEMLGDDDQGGFIGQMKAYGRLVAGGDPQRVREHFDRALDAILAGDDAAAWDHIRAIARAAEIPSTADEVRANEANDRPRFATPHRARDGNSEEDLALSLYGFATGIMAMSGAFPTPEAARAHFEDFYTARGARAAAIGRAAGLPG
jgi:hypothetical protein